MSGVGTARCDLSAADMEFRTALHWAAVLGNSEMVALLLERGASAHAQDSVGATPLHYAVSYQLSGEEMSLFSLSSISQAQNNHVVRNSETV